MNKWLVPINLVLMLTTGPPSPVQELNALLIREDLAAPPFSENGRPAAGKFVRQFLPEYENTEIYHALYLPTDWERGKKYPIIVEYAGNTVASSSDSANGRPEGCNLGYGITKGIGSIWVCLPYIETDHKTYAKRWWGDLKATVNYFKTVVPKIASDYGGDTNALFIAGFSRGAIACNFIGLHDDDIAALWTGFICHSHYDGVNENWPYAGGDRASATKRLMRLGNRPQFISHEISAKLSLEETRQFLQDAHPKGNFAFVEIPFTNHTDRWVYRDIPQRDALRGWFHQAAKISAGKVKN